MRKRDRRGLIAAGVVLMVLGGLAAARAQTERQQVVRDVRVRYTDKLPADPAYVLAQTVVRVGQFVSAADLARDQRALLDTGRFADVRVLVEPVAGDGEGVRVIYVVARRSRFAPPLRLIGVDQISAGRVTDWLDFHEGQPLDDTVLAARCAKVRDEYRKRYYPDAQVTAAIEPFGTAGQAHVKVTVHEGEKCKVVGFRFEGNRALEEDELRNAIAQPSPWNPLRIFRKKRYDAQELEDARIALRDAYLNRGYLDVQVGEPRLVALSTHRQRAVYPIVEGNAYRVSTVTLEGVTLFPEGELRSAVAAVLRPGDAAGRDTVQQASKALRDYYGRRGYVDTSVRTALTAAKSAARVAVAFTVREGELATVRSIAIRGNTRTRDKVIRRELGLQPGALLDEVQAERDQRRLENLGYFESVRFFERPVADQAGQRDVVYEVREKSTGNFMVGAGFSSIDNVIGFMEVTQANFDIANWPYFHGGGQKARASVELASERKTIDLSLTEPWFLDRRLSLMTEAYRRELGYREYDEKRLGGGTGITVPLPVGRANLRYLFEQVRLDDVEEGEFFLADDPAVPYRFTDEDTKYYNAPLRLSWLYDTRNRSPVPTSGTQANLFGEVSGSFTGGDNEVYGVGGQIRHWLPIWFDHVISLKLRAESVDSFGDTGDVPIGDRLFLGGGRTLRGFEYRDVGPKVIPPPGSSGRHHPIGGKTMALASAEYTVPVAKVLRLAAFYDVGNVWEDSFDVGSGDWASSAGVGIRFDIPGFPIRIDYAVPLSYDDELTDDQRWVIWIGFD